MNKELIRSAVELLVESNRYSALKKELRELITARETMPRRFAAELSVLNELIDLEKTSPEAFANVINLVETRRRVIPSSSNADYQRDYMRQSRARRALALKLEEIDRGKPLTPVARKSFKDAVNKKWMAARDAYIASQGELTWKERNDVTSDFWRTIDNQLEERLIMTKMRNQK